MRTNWTFMAYDSQEDAQHDDKEPLATCSRGGAVKWCEGTSRGTVKWCEGTSRGSAVKWCEGTSRVGAVKWRACHWPSEHKSTACKPHRETDSQTESTTPTYPCQEPMKTPALPCRHAAMALVPITLPFIRVANRNGVNLMDCGVTARDKLVDRLSHPNHQPTQIKCMLTCLFPNIERSMTQH